MKGLRISKKISFSWNFPLNILFCALAEPGLKFYCCTCWYIFFKVFWHDPKQCFMRRKTIWNFSALQCINFHKDCWLHFFLQHDDKSWECVNHHQSPPSLHYWHLIHSKYTTKKYITFCVLTEQGVFTNLIIIIMEMIKIIINIIDKHLSLTIHRSHLISLKKIFFAPLSLASYL